jgi:hypothetical protein
MANHTNDMKYIPCISVLASHVSTINGLIEEKGLTIMEDLSDNEDSEEIQDIITNYIRRIITKKDINSIICEYGISKSMKLFNDFHRIGMGDSCKEISDILSTNDYSLEKEVVDLILKEEIGFETNWRTTSDDDTL